MDQKKHINNSVEDEVSKIKLNMNILANQCRMLNDNILIRVIKALY